MRRALLATVLLLFGCSSSDEREPESYQALQRDGAEAASIALDAMREAAEDGDWETYVDRFYGEQHKFASPDQRDLVVERFRGPWGEEVLPVLVEASQLTPRIVEDRALFERDGELIFILHKDDDGRWTFHL
jgi:hypothetical protein